MTTFPAAVVSLVLDAPPQSAVNAARAVTVPGNGWGDGTRFDLSAHLVPEVHRFVARRVANADDAADIAQQTLVLACVGLSRCRNENLSPWLLAIARHLIVDHHRAQSRHAFLEWSAALAEREPELQTPPDTAVAAGECRERLKSLLGGGSRPVRLEHQVALLLADVYGHSYKHSAELLRMSLPCFKLLLHRARASLRAIAVPRRAGERFRATGSLGVTCRLRAAELLAMRRELLAGLKP